LGRYSVDGDAVVPQLERKIPGETNDCTLGCRIGWPAFRVAPLAGCGVDDAARTLLHHDGHRVAASVERALEVHTHDGVEVGLVDLMEQSIASDTCVVHENVEPAIVLDSSADELLGLAKVGDGVVVGNCFATVLANQRDDLIGRGSRASSAVALHARVVDDDFGALGCEGHGVGTTDASPAAGDDRYFIFQIFAHDFSLLRCADWPLLGSGV
jgi:hypothetical protein